ncbi:MAG: DUF2169 domain-containing protein [Myxococcales bacterium]|nr:DUF2169 domain-containing protein [Myxococcales bacterium]
MWLLRNRTPYAAGRNWVRDPRGVHWYLIAVRCSYTLESRGRLDLADEQPPPVLVPEYTGVAGASSLRLDSDLLERKPGTDVIVLGSAHAPRGRPAPSVSVVLRAGALEKQLLVHGDRVYRAGAAGLATTSPQPFVARPIIYELAFGGHDTGVPDPRRQHLDERNPIGRGFPSHGRKDQPAHCIEYSSGAAEARGPAGFGPIDRSWLPRRTFAGTYDAKWMDSKWPLLPDDYDPRFAMCAPADQQTAAPMSGGERIGLFNMSPDGALAFDLPRTALRLSTSIRGRRHEHGANLTTVVVEPELMRLSVCWQSALRVAAPDVDYVSTTDIDERGAR